MKAVIRWAGSKRSLLPRLRPYWQGTEGRYIEPFAGSACFFFDAAPAAAVLGDLNHELIASYRALARDASLVVECLNRLPPGRGHYYKIRDLLPESLGDAELAARFFYLNRMCFNGLYRTNKAGRFNVPYGPPKSAKSAAFPDYVKAGELLRQATLIAGDFEKTLSLARRGDFAYIDPPYAVSRRRVFSEYLPGSFSLADLSRLSDILHDLDGRGVRFLVSYADSREARRLLEPWAPHRMRVRRHIAGFAGARRFSYDLIASNFSPLCA